MNWKDNGSNSVLEADNFHISYNPCVRAPLLAMILSLVVDDVTDNVEETALCIKQEDGSRTWLILNGDFREEYEQAFPDIVACIDVYKKHPEHRSCWSNDEFAKVMEQK